MAAGLMAYPYFRPKNIAEQENDMAAAHRFKARPLNRKVCT